MVAIEFAARAVNPLSPAGGERVGVRGSFQEIKPTESPPHPDGFAIRPLPGRRGEVSGVRGKNKIDEPDLDAIGDRALPREPAAAPQAARVQSARRRANRRSTKWGPVTESKPYRPGPRSTTGRAGMRGGWKPRGR